MAEMPNHKVGDAVFVREEQQEMPYPAKVHNLPSNQTYVGICYFDAPVGRPGWELYK